MFGREQLKINAFFRVFNFHAPYILNEIVLSRSINLAHSLGDKIIIKNMKVDT